MKKYYKKFLSTEEFYIALDTIPAVTDKINVQSMVESLPKLSPRKFFLTPLEGSTIACTNFKQFMKVLQSLTKISVHPVLSFSRGTVLNVFTSVDYFNTESVEDSVGKAIDDVVVVEEKVAPEEITLVKEKEIKEEAPLFDKEFAKSLSVGNTSKVAKNDLEVYGKKFGIDLKKNKSFSNMLEDLVTFIGE